MLAYTTQLKLHALVTTCYNTNSERIRKRQHCRSKLNKFQRSTLQTDKKTSNQKWTPSSSQQCTAQAPRDAATLFYDTLIFPPINSKLGPTEDMSGVRYFLWKNSTAVHLLIEPGSQREAQYRTLFLFLYLSY